MLPNQIEVINSNSLYKNERVDLETYQAISNNQHWIYGRVSPLVGRYFDPATTLLGPVFRGIITARKLRGSDTVPVDNYYSLNLVVLGDDSEVEFTIKNLSLDVVDTVLVGTPSGTPRYGFSEVEVPASGAYYIEAAQVKSGKGLEAVFVCWPFLNSSEKFPK